jgi:uncharacterized protein YgiM (DUF1202 family)
MRKNVWLVIWAMLSTGLVAQPVTNPPPPGPIETPAAAPAATNATAAEAASPATTAPTNPPAEKAKKSAKKKTAKKKPAGKQYELRSVPLVAGPAVVMASNVNVRGQAKLTSEVVTRVTKGQEVQVLEEIKLKNSGPDEPSAWAKILLPPGAHVWLNATYVDPTAQTVKARRLNVRSGPGENYSVLGRLERGEAVKPITSQGDWTEIEPPTNAYAFVAAQYLSQENIPAAPILAAETNVPPTTVAEQPAVAPPPTEPPVVPPPTEPAVTPPTTEPAAATNAPATEPAQPAVVEPPPKRIVMREGIVRGSVSIQAPTPYSLIDPDSRKIINYLHATDKDLDLGRWKGLRIIVTGEEGLDERWRNTPVIEVQRIQVLDER